MLNERGSQKDGHADSRPQLKEAERQNRRLHLMPPAKPKSNGVTSLTPGPNRRKLGREESKGFSA